MSKKFAVAIAVQGEDLYLEVIEARDEFDALMKGGDRLGIFPECSDEYGDDPRPDNLSDFGDFLADIDASAEVVEIK
jgi:hypothetical protein